MTTTLDIGTITQTIPELIERLAPGDEVVLTKDNRPVARVVSEPASPPPKPRPEFGWMAGVIEYMAPDFDEPLEDMKEYME